MNGGMTVMDGFRDFVPRAFYMHEKLDKGVLHFTVKLS
jgi:hypothetical protein